MTDEQIENWRKVLCLQLGPYALIMPKEQIIKIRDNMQEWANDPETIRRCEEENAREEAEAARAIADAAPCSCDPKMYGSTRHEDGRVTCNKCKKVRP